MESGICAMVRFLSLAEAVEETIRDGDPVAMEGFTHLIPNAAGHDRARLGLTTRGPTKLITDLCVFEPDTASKEMTVSSIHPGVTRDQIAENTGWPVHYAANVTQTPAPT